MALITTTGLETVGAYTISAQHTSGELAPTFTVSLFPERGNEDRFAVHRDWTPPASITVTVSGVTWTCVPGDTPRRISGDEGVSYSVQYIPEFLYTLRYGRYKKNVAWISAPQWQINQYLSAYDTEEWDVFHTDADVYSSNGFTVGQILVKLGNLIGRTIVSLLPDFHPPQATITLRKEQVLLGWMQSLLPSGFVYTWDWRDNALRLGLAERARTAITLPPYALDVDIDDPALIQYDQVVVTGAPYKINAGLTLGDDHFTTKVTYNPRAVKVIEEVMPPLEQEINGQAVTTVTTRSTQMGPDGTPFAILSEDDEVSGAIYDEEGDYSHQALTQRATRTYTYANNDPIIYMKPRLTQGVEVLDGYATVLNTSQIATSNGVIYYLLEDLRVLDRTQFLAESTPAMLLSAYTRWVDDFQTTTEEVVYVTSADVTQDWPEGYERTRTRTIERVFYGVNDIFYPCTDSPRAILEDVARRLQVESSPSIATFSTQTLRFEVDSRNVVLNTPGAYVYRDTRTNYDQESGRFITVPTSTQINSTPPSSPSEYRTEPLKVTIGDPSGDVIFSTAAQIPTANPHDFETWGSKLYYDLTHRQRAMTAEVAGYILPQGYRVGGGTVIGWSASRTGNEDKAQLTII